MYEHNAEEDMEIAGNVPLLQNAYKISKNPMNDHWKENGCKILYVTESSCHKKKLPVTERNFLSQEETSCHKKKLTAKGRNFL